MLMLSLNGHGYQFCNWIALLRLVSCIPSTSTRTLIICSTTHPTRAPSGRHPDRRRTVARRPLFGLSRLLFQLWVSTKNPFAQQVPSPSPSSLSPSPTRQTVTNCSPVSLEKTDRVKTCARRTSDWGGNYPCWDTRGHDPRSQWRTGHHQMQNRSYMIFYNATL